MGHSFVEIDKRITSCTIIGNEDFNRLIDLIEKIRRAFIEAEIENLKFKTIDADLVAILGQEKADLALKKRIEDKTNELNKVLDTPLNYEIELENKTIKEPLVKDCLKEHINKKPEKIKKISISVHTSGSRLRFEYGHIFFRDSFYYSFETYRGLADSIAKQLESYAISITQSYGFIRNLPFGDASFYLGIISICLLTFANINSKTLDPQLLHWINSFGVILFVGSLCMPVISWIIRSLFPSCIITVGDGMHRLNRLKFYRRLLGIGGILGIIIKIAIPRILSAH